VNYNIASFSTGERKKQFKSDRKIQDIEMTIKHVFEAIILTHQFPRSEISICLQVIQVDGGALHTAINAATLALIDAGIPMLDYVCACSASFANDTSFLGTMH
jgi:exosome complex component RRP41